MPFIPEYFTHISHIPAAWWVKGTDETKKNFVCLFNKKVIFGTWVMRMDKFFSMCTHNIKNTLRLLNVHNL